MKLLFFLFSVFWIFIDVVLIKEVFFRKGSSSLQCAGYILHDRGFADHVRWMWQWESHPRHTANQKISVLSSHPKRKPLSSKPWERIKFWVNLQVTSPLHLLQFVCYSFSSPQKGFLLRMHLQHQNKVSIMKHDRQVVISKLSPPIQSDSRICFGWLKTRYTYSQESTYPGSPRMVFGIKWRIPDPTNGQSLVDVDFLGYTVYIYYPPWNYQFAPENQWLENDFLLGHPFSGGYVSFRECRSLNFINMRFYVR